MRQETVTRESGRTDEGSIEAAERPLIVGEVLFDVFPDGSRVLGGAPFNVAWNLCALGADPLLISRVGTDVPEAWGDWKERAINWETLTAVTLLESGADIIVLRHPESVRRVKAAIEELMAVPELA